MLFLFDYDGVIADSFIPLLDVCIEAKASFIEGRAPTGEDFRTIRNLTFEALAGLIGIPEGKCNAYAEKVFEIQQKGWHVHPFPDVIAAMKKMAAEHTIAVVTNSQSHIVSAALDAFGVGSSVRTVKGGESGLAKSERIAALQKAFVSSNDATYMIGDTVGDILAGKQAGVQTIAVTWGFQQRDLLHAESPDYLLDHPQELLSIAEGNI